MVHESNTDGQLKAGGFSNGETILIPDVKKTAEVFIILFHELGHNIDKQADFVMELMFDVFNRSINKRFSLPDDKRVLTVFPDERNVRTIEISRYLIKRNWNAPGFFKNFLQKKPD